MVFALAGDSTTTTFMTAIQPVMAKEDPRDGTLAQRDEIAGMTLDAAGQFQFEQQR